jgi:hypothetical protein
LKISQFAVNRSIFPVLKLIRLRLEFAIEHEQQRLTLTEFLRQSKIRWHGIRLNAPDWADQSHTLAVTVESAKGERLMHLIFNAWREPLEFQLPAPLEGTRWRRLIDTALPSPLDIHHSLHATQIEASSYSVQPHSTVVLSSESFKHDGYGGWRKLFLNNSSARFLQLRQQLLNLSWRIEASLNSDPSAADANSVSRGVVPVVLRQNVGAPRCTRRKAAEEQRHGFRWYRD